MRQARQTSEDYFQKYPLVSETRAYTSTAFSEDQLFVYEYHISVVLRTAINTENIPAPLTPALNLRENNFDPVALSLGHWLAKAHWKL